MSEQQKRRVLLIEDNTDIRESMRMMLDFWGHEVMQARTGDEGIAIALKEKPDVALVDIGLPGNTSGYDVARAIRADSSGWTSSIRLVAVTGYGTPADRARALEAGFDAHLVKPVEPAQLSSALVS